MGDMIQRQGKANLQDAMKFCLLFISIDFEHRMCCRCFDVLSRSYSSFCVHENRIFNKVVFSYRKH